MELADKAVSFQPVVDGKVESSSIQDLSIPSEQKTSKEEVRIIEGSAEIVVPSEKNVFYNPVQEFNRDLSIAFISQFAEERFKTKRLKRTASGDVKVSENEGQNEEELLPGKYYEDGISILEALSATGLRSIRYAKEVAGLRKVVANDISETAVATIGRNIVENQVEHLVATSHSDASLLMYKCKAEGEMFDVVDLDPYGCPSRFLEGAVQVVKEGGILLVTCTDMAVLCGNSPETCFVKYGSIPLRSSACHEMALRIVLKTVASHANRFGRYITPVLCFSADFYIRIIVRINTSPFICKSTITKLSYVYQCVGCKSWELQPLGILGETSRHVKLPRVSPRHCCQHCNSQVTMGGPIWTGELCDASVVTEVAQGGKVLGLATGRRVHGLLRLLLDELPDVPLYYTLNSLCATVHCTTIPQVTFRSALLNMGKEVSLSHAAPNSIKTKCDGSVVWEIVRAWEKTHPVGERWLQEGNVAHTILRGTTSRLEVDLSEHPAARLEQGLLRYQRNPKPNWGPANRAVARVSDVIMGKSKINQNKNSRKKALLNS